MDHPARPGRRTLVAALAAAAALAPAPPAGAGDRVEGQPFATRSVVHARHGMVAAAHPLAVQAGLEILRKGGTAADAAVAVNAALAVLEPVACGLGGDLFALAWDPRRKRLDGLNASGRAPLAAAREKVPATPDGTIPLHSPWAWTVPGAASGWFALHARHGRLSMKEILAPAIALAEEGAPVPQHIAAAWKRSERVFGRMPGFAETFLPGGRAPAEGEIFRNPALARTLRLLAEGGEAAFYRGPVAKALVEFSRAQGGLFELEDFARHRADWVDPISTTYRGVGVHQLPPPGQGVVTLMILDLVEALGLGRLGRDAPDYWHGFVEAKKLAFADRARWLADPARAEVPVGGLLSKDYARRRAALVDPARAALVVPPGDPAVGSDTTYLAVADGEGMIVSLIQSNYTGFGSGYAVPALGFGLHNRGAQFSLDAAHPNRLEPGKRPFHTIIPGFLTRDGEGWCALGVMGGATQPQGQAQVIVNLLDHGMNLQEAGDAPRFVHDGSQEPTGTGMADGGRLALERGVAEPVRRALAARGHRLVEMPGNFGGYQAVCRDPRSGVLSGASESRKDGHAAGY